MICILVFALQAPAQQSVPSASSSADAWVKYGVESAQNGDMTTAMSSFEAAIKADPRWVAAYECRGQIYLQQNNLDAAMADFTQAIQIDPKYAEAYYNRGVISAEKGDFDGALSDFNRTIELNSKYSPAYYNRGHVKYFKADLDGAIADLDQAITLNPSSPFSYFIRGLARLAKDDREGATTDFQQSATNGYPNAALWLWIVETENGDRGVARIDLSDFLSKPQLFKPDDWPTQIGNFLLEKITQDQLMAKAKENVSNPYSTSEAWFYSGMARHFAGDTKGALACFQQAIATGSKVIEISVEAQREVTLLQQP